jgi:hypothetical protein
MIFPFTIRYYGITLRSDKEIKYKKMQNIVYEERQLARKYCIEGLPVVNAYKRLKGWVNKPFALNRVLLT